MPSTFPTDSHHEPGEARRAECRTPRPISIAVAAVMLVVLGAAPAAQAEQLDVITTLPELAYVVEAIGGEHVRVESLLDGARDPHKIDAKPSLMAKLSKADLYVEIGLGLELWSTNLLEGARNPDIKVGQAGHLYASKGIDLLEKPAVASRSEGDMHPYGNPHVWLDPLNMIVIGDNVHEALTTLAPEAAEDFDANKKAFERRIQEQLFGAELVGLLGGDVLVRLAKKGELFSFLEEKKLRGEPLVSKLGGWMALAAPLRGKPVVFYHQSWVYFARRYGIEIAEYVEEKPGIPPSAAHRDRLEELIERSKIPVIAITSYYDASIAEKLAESTGAKLLVVPNGIGGIKGADDYSAFMTTLLSTLVAEY